MSNRSLFEINHDFADAIKRDPAGFVADLDAYLSSGSMRCAAILKDRYHINLHGIRHHAEAFEIKWGVYKSSHAAGMKVEG